MIGEKGTKTLGLDNHNCGFQERLNLKSQIHIYKAKRQSLLQVLTHKRHTLQSRGPRRNPSFGSTRVMPGVA